MIETYRVLGSMLALEEFDVGEIVALLHVKRATVYSVMRREKDVFERLGSKETRGPGGRYRRYRIRPNKVQELRKKIEGVLDKLEISDSAYPTQGRGVRSSQQVPRALLAVEDYLIREFPEAPVGRKEHFLRLADLALSSPSTKKLSSDAQIQSHLRLVQYLSELRRGELELEKGTVLEPPRFREKLRKRFDETVKHLRKMNLFQEATDMKEGFAHSPIQPQNSRTREVTKELMKIVVKEINRIRLLSDESQREQSVRAAARVAQDMSLFPSGAFRQRSQIYQDFLTHESKSRPYCPLSDEDAIVLGTDPAIYCGETIIDLPDKGPHLVWEEFLALFDGQRRPKGAERDLQRLEEFHEQSRPGNKTPNKVA